MAAHKTRDPVPQFKSIEEEADFWDSHSPLDYPDYWTDAGTMGGEDPPGHILGVHLDAKLIGELAEVARSKGVGLSTLARVWLTERLTHEKEKRRPA